MHFRKKRTIAWILVVLMAVSVPTVSLAGSKATEARVYSYLTGSMGLNRAAASGVMTNIQAESGMKPNNLENIYNIRFGLTDAQYTSRVNKGIKKNGKYKTRGGKTRYFTKDYCGYGLCQWTSLSRRKKLLKKAKAKKVSIADVNMQMELLSEELRNDYPQVWATLKGAPNTAEGAYLSAVHFCVAFEIPANTNMTAASRGKKALKTYWKTYSGKAAKTSTASYFGLCGYEFPQTVKKGTKVKVRGNAISNRKVKSISGKIIKPNGEVVCSKTTLVGAKITKLSKMGSYLRFHKLKKGKYIFVISARDSKGRVVSAYHPFTVTSKGSTSTARGFTCTNKAKAYLKK